MSSRGPLGALYRVWGDGKQMVKNDIFDYFGLTGYSVPQLRAMGYIVWTPPRQKGEFIGEGDTFTYLNLIDNGLLGHKEDTPGGWAGLGPAAASSAQGAGGPTSYDDFLKFMERAAAGDVPRPPSPDPNFTAPAQNAFAARMKWSVTPTYAGAKS
ncbi:MAG: nucleoside hydrolase-like domain-containing protein [Gemmatimonadaceae bacterium]